MMSRLSDLSKYFAPLWHLLHDIRLNVFGPHPFFFLFFSFHFFLFFSLLGPIIGDFVESAEAQLLQPNPHMENIHKQGWGEVGGVAVRPLNCGRLSQCVLVKSSIIQQQQQNKKAGRHQSRIDLT